MADVLIYGASGHAKVIIDIIEQAGIHRIVGLVDETGAVDNLMGYQVVTNVEYYFANGVRSGVVAVGDNWQRCRLVSKVIDKCPGFNFVTAIHPSVRLSRDIFIGKGTVVMAGCNINPGTKIFDHCIINTGSNIDHDCTINDFASVAPGATLGGNVVVGECSAVGLGVSVIQKKEIGSHTVVGAGAVVINDIKSRCIAYGNPCKIVRDRDAGEPYL